MRKVAGCLRAVSMGEVNNGLYFKNSQQTLTAISGLITIVGLLLILSLAVKVFVDIFNQKTIQTMVDLVDQGAYNIKNS
jgi:hypothetical protein